MAMSRVFGRHIHGCDEPMRDAPAYIVELDAKLDIIIGQDRKIMTVQDDIAAALAREQADVANQTTVVASLAKYVAGLNKTIADLAAKTTDTTTAAALNALSDQLEKNTAQDAANIVANTSSEGATA